MKLGLNCQEVSRLISEGLDGDLALAERTRMRLHFAICEACRNVDEQMQFMRRAMRRLGSDERDPVDPPKPPDPPDLPAGG